MMPMVVRVRWPPARRVLSLITTTTGRFCHTDRKVGNKASLPSSIGSNVFANPLIITQAVPCLRPSRVSSIRK